ncbi:MAG: 50S ribosomal protein L16 [Candidatus Tyloplasma litorale]|nr:MAG: 50S ribosomal protein L16 [Mycoplasmatales bacterium]
MLQPKQMKYRKPFKPNNQGKAKRGTKINFGEYGLQAKAGAWITARQIEATRIAITRYLKRQGELYIRIFPQHPMTKKPLEVRMGKGKGSVDHYVANVKEGMILFELGGDILEADALEALRLGMHKLPIQCKIVKKGEEA